MAPFMSVRWRKSAVAVCAAFCAASAFASWTFDETKMTVTDGSWVFPVTGTRDALTLGKASARGGATVLDLTTGIEGGGAFVGLGPRFIQEGADSARKALVEVRLPETIDNIGLAAFAECENLTTVTPFLPAAVTNLGVSAFYLCKKLRGDVVLSNPNLFLEGSDNYQYATFFQCGIDSMDLSESKVTSTPLGFIRQTPNLKWVKYPETLTTLGGGSHYGCSSLADVSLLSFPSFGSDCFGGGKAMPYARITYPASNAGWVNYFSKNTDKRAWENAGAGNQNAYNATFKDGYTPIGYAKMGNSTLTSYAYASYFWLVPVTALTGVTVGITGNPEVGTVTPAYGDKGTITEFPYVCTAPEYDIDSDIVYHCIGYKIGRPSGASVLYGDLVESRTCSFKPEEDGVYYIQWQWEKVACKVDVQSFPSNLGSVSVSGSEFPGYPGCYAYNQPLTFTATPSSSAPFGRWFGSVTVENRTDNPLVLTIDEPKAVRPYFVADWTYDENAQTVSDGYWTISASGTREAIALGRPTTNGGITVLDLRKEISGGGAFVSIPNEFLYSGLPVEIRTTTTEVHLPETVTSVRNYAFYRMTALEKVTISSKTDYIGEGAFWNCTALASVTPFLPSSVAFVGPQAFGSTRQLKQDLTLNLTNCLDFVSGGDSMNGPFFTSGITSIDMSGSVITNIGSGSFRETTNVKTVLLPPNLVTIGHAAFYNCRSLTALDFPPTLANIDTYAFCACSSLATITPTIIPASLKALNWAVFNNCSSLRGDVVVSRRTAVNGGGSEGFGNSTFFGAGIDTADFSAARRMTYTPVGFLRECRNLTSVKYPKTLKEVKYCFHYGCSALKDIQFQSYPTNFTAVLGDAFGGTFAYGRIVYPAGDAGWQSYLDAYTNDNFTAWDPESAAAQQYLSRFPDGWKPIGYMKIGKGTQWGETIKWMVPHNFATGLTILLY